MPIRPEDGEIIDSWKGIAAHFGVTTRSVQLWEQEQGLPVHRQPGVRGRVFAYRSELDAWRRSSSEEQNAEPAPEPSVRRRIAAPLALAAVGLLGVLGLFVFVREAGGPPALTRIEGQFLVAQNERGAELWRRGLPEAPKPAAPGDPNFVPAVIADLDGDSRPEVVFAYQRFDSPASDEVICYSSNGRVMWRFQPGRTVRTSEHEFPNHYRVRSLTLLPGEGRLGGRILVNSRHEPDYPSQIASLDAAGRMVSEYWHSGHLVKTLIADLERDGAPEILLAGIVNGSRCGDLVVLDATGFSGASTEENAAYQLLGMPAAAERARVLFPRTNISRYLNHYGIPTVLLMGADEIRLHLADLTGVGTGTTHAYVFSRDLRLLRVEPGDGMMVTYNALKAQRILPVDFEPDTLEDLSAVRFVTTFRPGLQKVAQAAR